MSAQVSAVRWRKLGAILVDRGLITADQLRRGFEEQAISGRRLGEIVVEEGWVSPLDLALALAEQHNLPFVDLIPDDVDFDLAVLLPEHLARRYKAVPVRDAGEFAVLVAIADPSDLQAIDELRLALKRKIELAVADVRDIEAVIRSVYRADLEVDELEPSQLEVTEEREEIWNSATSIPAVSGSM